MALNEIAQQILDYFNEDENWVNNLEWCAFYSKYNEECLCFKDGWNFQVSDLVDKGLTDNRAVNCEKLKPFYEYLGERIALSLNILKGKTNDELKEMLKEEEQC